MWDKHQITNPKSQTNPNERNPKFKTNRLGHLELEFETYLGFGVWNSEFRSIDYLNGD